MLQCGTGRKDNTLCRRGEFQLNSKLKKKFLTHFKGKSPEICFDLCFMASCTVSFQEITKYIALHEERISKLPRPVFHYSKVGKTYITGRKSCNILNSSLLVKGIT